MGGAGEGFGFSVRGDAPVIIAGVDGGSLAEVSKIRLLSIDPMLTLLSNFKSFNSI
jgi:hypothetical protein